MSQSLNDDIPSPEAVTRAALCTWVAIFVPVAVTVMLDRLFGQTVPVLLDRTVRRVLSRLQAALANDIYRQKFRSAGRTPLDISGPRGALAAAPFRR